MITFLAPLAGLFLLTLPLIVVLHMRHSRPRPLPVTTMRFWQEATRHQRQRLTWRRPPRNLLLLLQLLVAAILGLALLRPALPLPSLPGAAQPPQLIVVLDRSLAMRATDVAPSRFAVAKDRARALILAAGADEPVTLLTLGADPQLQRSRDAADRAGLLAALDALPAGGGRADLNGALPVLRALLLPERENRVVLLSGGAFATPPDGAALGALAATVRWERIGDETDNLAITRFVARPSALAPDRVELFARVANYGAGPATARGTLDADGATVDQKALQLAPGGTVELVWQLPRGTRGARLRIDGRDAMPFDNEAQVVLRQNSETRILLVSDAPGGDLGRALTAQPGAVLTTVAPAAYLDRDRYDLTVFDGVVPERLPPGGVLLVNPPADNRLIARVGDPAAAGETPSIVRYDRESPLLAGVDLSGVTFAPQAAFQLPDWASEVVGAKGGPLVLAGRFEGREVVAFTFDLARSNLPRKLAFPLLVSNTVERLQTHRVPAAVALGEGATLEPVAGTASVQLRDPAGRTRDLDLRQSPGGAPTAYVVPDEPGLYTLIERDSTGTTLLQEGFAVNGGDAVASNLRGAPASLPAGTGGITPATATGLATNPAPSRLGELWPVLLALVLALLLLEWVVGLLGPGAPRGLPARVRPRAGLTGPARGTRGR